MLQQLFVMLNIPSDMRDAMLQMGMLWEHLGRCKERREKRM